MENTRSYWVDLRENVAVQKPPFINSFSRENNEAAEIMLLGRHTGGCRVQIKALQGAKRMIVFDFIAPATCNIVSFYLPEGTEIMKLPPNEMARRLEQSLYEILVEFAALEDIQMPADDQAPSWVQDIIRAKARLKPSPVPDAKVVEYTEGPTISEIPGM